MLGNKAKPPQTVNPMQIEATGFRAFYILKFAGNPCADETTATIFGVDRYLIDNVINQLTKDIYSGVFKIYTPINASDRPVVGDMVCSKINVFNTVFGITHDVKGFDADHTAYLCVLPNTHEIVPLLIFTNQVYQINCPIIPRFVIKFIPDTNFFPTDSDFGSWLWPKLASAGVGQSISNFNSFGNTVTFNLANNDALVDSAFTNENLTAFLDYEGKITNLGSNCFSGQNFLTTVVLPNVTSHGSGLFDNCIAIQKIIMPLALEFTDNCFENISGNDIEVQFSAVAMGSDAKTLGLFINANNITFIP